MSLISVRNLSIGFTGTSLLNDVSCEIEPGHRIGLLGRNGAGKSTFLKILAGQIQPDSGDVVYPPGITVAMLGQDVPTDLHDTITNVVATGISAAAVHGDEWKHQNAVEQILSRMELDGSDEFDTLSSGMKRRVLLARALVAKPDFLLLDEPTNHLDIDAIGWLEQFLSKFVTSFMFVTHDRRILEENGQPNSRN